MPPEAVLTQGEVRAALAADPWRRALPLLGATWLALIALFAPDWGKMFAQWWDSSTYNHVLLVPAILGWLVWLRLPELRKLTPRAWWPGLVLDAAVDGMLLVTTTSPSAYALSVHAGVWAPSPWPGQTCGFVNRFAPADDHRVIRGTDHLDVTARVTMATYESTLGNNTKGSGLLVELADYSAPPTVDMTHFGLPGRVALRVELERAVVAFEIAVKPPLPLALGVLLILGVIAFAKDLVEWQSVRIPHVFGAVALSLLELFVAFLPLLGYGILGIAATQTLYLVALQRMPISIAPIAQPMAARSRASIARAM